MKKKYPTDGLAYFAYFAYIRGMDTDDLNTGDVAMALGVAPSTVVTWYRQGKFPNAYKLSSAPNSPLRYPAGDVERFKNARVNSNYREHKGGEVSS